MCICVKRTSSGVYPNTPSGVEINPFHGHNKLAYLYYIGQYFPYYAYIYSYCNGYYCRLLRFGPDTYNV